MGITDNNDKEIKNVDCGCGGVRKNIVYTNSIN